MNTKIFLSFLLLLNMKASFAGFLEVITPHQIKKALGPYPAQGSVEEAEDFETLLKYQENRTEEECALAGKDSKPNLKNLFGGENGLLSKRELRRVTPFVLKYFASSGISIYIAKKTYKRPRPFVANPLIKPCIALATSGAYPSGHTAVAVVLARVLSRIYPERAEAFMKRADEVALYRILGGVHHPSDIVSGKKLGEILSNNITGSKAFQLELSTMK